MNISASSAYFHLHFGHNSIITSGVIVLNENVHFDRELTGNRRESLNRKVKNLKRLGRGYTNFEHFRNRFLFATRNNTILDGTGNNDQVQYYEDEG